MSTSDRLSMLMHEIELANALVDEINESLTRAETTARTFDFQTSKTAKRILKK